MPDGVHLESANNSYQSWEYCGKEDSRVDGPWEFGVAPNPRVNVAGDKASRNV